MITFVEGTVEYIEENAVVLNNGGFGARIFMSPSALSNLKVGEQKRIHTFLRVAEDIFDLYGFLTREELEMFKMIISVSGAGPKAALAILSVMSPQTLTLAVVTDDYKSITKAQGVGPKLAQKIVLELKDKLKGKEIHLDGADSAVITPASGGNDAVDALVVLGYSQSEAMRAVASVSPDLSTEETIKAALIRLMKQQEVGHAHRTRI